MKAGAASRVKIVVETERGEIGGRVLDETGAAVPDAFVQAEREPDRPGAADGSTRRRMQWSWTHAPVLTDVEGTFAITKLSPGTYTVRAFRKGGGECVLEKVALGSRVTLAIKAEGSLAGSVVLARGGKAPESFSIQALDAKAGVSREETFFRTNGRWALRNLPEGTFSLTASAVEGRETVETRLAAGERRESIVLTLQAPASARGRVVALDTGEPLAGMIVIATAADGTRAAGAADEQRRHVTNADGRYEIVRAPTGKGRLTVYPKGFGQGTPLEYTSSYVPVELRPGVTTDVPDIRVARRRNANFRGDLGFSTREPAAGEDLEARRHIVSVVRPGGPASKAGLGVDDEIVSVDGYDVVGRNAYLFSSLTYAAEGTRITLGLRRGIAIIVELGSPQ